MTTKCNRCSISYSTSKAAYVFPQTGGLCWTCADRISTGMYQAQLTGKQAQELRSRERAIEQLTDKEINTNCQLAGLPKLGKK